MSRRTKFVYGLLLVGLVLQPHLIRGHIFGFTEPAAESLGTIALLIFGYVAYWRHRKDVQGKQQEVHQLSEKLDVSSRRLIESYEYIGLVNRKLPLAERMTSDLLERKLASKKEKAQLFEELLTTAAGLAGVDWGLFRVVDARSGRTKKEFVGSGKQYAVLKTQISNRQLLTCNSAERKIYAFDTVLVLRSSDTTNNEQMFLILPKTITNLNENALLLQNITDQALLFYNYLYEK